MGDTGESAELNFFGDAGEFFAWMKKNHKKNQAVWLGFYKRSVDKKSFSILQAFDIALCFGWTSDVMRGIDYLTYKARFMPRKPQSVWSPKNVQRFLVLQKKGLVQAAGKKAFADRNQEKARRMAAGLSAAQLKQFKANKKAWAFFTSQTPSYQKYMQQWVSSAKKAETQESRLSELIKDSAKGSKLARVLKAQEKFKKRFEPGKTPVEEGKNLGPLTGVELRSIGIETLEQLQRAGWENTFQRLVQMYPQRCNLNMLYSLAGAVNDVNRKQLDPEIKAECKNFFQELNYK